MGILEEEVWVVDLCLYSNIHFFNLVALKRGLSTRFSFKVVVGTISVCLFVFFFF